MRTKSRLGQQAARSFAQEKEAGEGERSKTHAVGDRRESGVARSLLALLEEASLGEMGHVVGRGERSKRR
jgi:hypothetical protein